MKYTLPFFFILSLFLFDNISAQDQKKLDQLLEDYKNLPDNIKKYKTLKDIFDLTLYNKPDTAKKYVDLSLKLSKKINYKQGIAEGSYNKGVFYNSVGYKDSARYYYDRAYQQYKQNKDINGQTAVIHGLAILMFAETKYTEAIKLIDQNIEIQKNPKTLDLNRLASSYELKAYIHISKGNYRIALIENLKALRIIEKIGDDIKKADILSTQGEIEYALDDVEKSLDYQKQALAIYNQENDKFYESELLLTIANTYIKIKKYDEATRYLNESLRISRDIKSPSIEAMILGNLGTISMEKKNYSKALNYFNKSESILRESDRPSILAENWLNKSNLFKRTNQSQIAKTYLDSVISFANEVQENDLLKRAYLNLSELHFSQGHFEKAFISHKAFHSISNEVLNKVKSQQIEELRIIYDTEKKEQQIELLEQKEKVNKLQKSLLGGGLLLSFGLIVIGFYGFRQKMKRKQLEKEKVDTELAFKKKELTTHALHLAKKNEVLEGLKLKAEELKNSENDQNGYQQLIRTINFDLKDDNNWENFSKYFQEVHKDFNSEVKQKFPDVTSNELRLMSLLKMNLSSKEIASILNISQEGIKKARYRLRKKLDISTEESLQDLVLSL